jgi:hypothetical protein
MSSSTGHEGGAPAAGPGAPAAAVPAGAAALLAAQPPALPAGPPVVFGGAGAPPPVDPAAVDEPLFLRVFGLQEMADQLFEWLGPLVAVPLRSTCRDMRAAARAHRWQLVHDEMPDGAIPVDRVSWAKVMRFADIVALKQCYGGTNGTLPALWYDGADELLEDEIGAADMAVFSDFRKLQLENCGWLVDDFLTHSPPQSFSTILTLSLIECPNITGAGITPAMFPSLLGMFFFRCDALQYINPLETLQMVSVPNPVPAFPEATIAALSGLRWLNISLANLSGATFEHLPHLRTLSVVLTDGSPALNDEFVAHLRNLRFLAFSDLRTALADPPDFTGLRHLTRLEKLELAFVEHENLDSAAGDPRATLGEAARMRRSTRRAVVPAGPNHGARVL